MAEVLLTHAVNEAEEAIESGNYGGAIETCQRILGQFPEFAGAHRIMGDAYAEQGDLDAARQAYQRTLERDPQSIPAHLGLGMMAEDAGDRESALAYFQVAWEIDPRRRDLREHVSRVSQQLYGSDGRLYLTRAALASLHFHAGRWDRAVSEAAQVLQEFTSRIDVQVRLAEALWRRGDDEQARQACQSILRALPSAVVPLLILADIHRHEGDQATADEYRKQARDIDPDGVRAADLIMIGLDDQADFLSIESIPTIDDQVVHEEPARYAPAPDFMSTEPEDSGFSAEPDEDIELPQPISADVPVDPSMDAPGVQPFRWEDIGDEDLEVSDIDGSVMPEEQEAPFDPATEFALPTDEEIEQARPSEARPSGFTDMLDSLDSEGMQPFDPGGTSEEPPRHDDVLDEASLPSDEDLDRSRPADVRERGYTEMLDTLDSEGMQPFDPTGGATPPPVPEPDDVPTEIGMDHLALPTDEELEQARPGNEQERGHTEMLGSLDAEGMQPFDPFGGEPETTSGEDAPQESVDELDLSLPSDEDLEQARPGEETPRGFTGMLNSLDDEGVQPFDPSGDQPVEETMEPPAIERVEEAVPEQAAADVDEEDMPFDLDWSGIDTEIEEAIPGDLPSGYTDELRDLDDFGLEPFAFSDESTTEISETDSEAEPVAPESSEPADDEMDLDQLTAGWDLAAEPEDADSATEDSDLIDVVFAGEETHTYPETEQLRPDVDVADDSVSDDEWSLDDSFDELLAEGEAPGGEWPAQEPDLAAALDVDLADTVSEIQEMTGAIDDDAISEVVARRPGTGSLSVDRIGLDESLINRARSAKQQLVESGRISGTAQFPGSEISLDNLRQAVESDPLSIESRISLASALVSDHPDEALEQFRWVYRNAPDRGPEVVEDLVRLIVVMREREVGVHRLLGALYRRHGDWLAAATHYEESLVGKRRRPTE